mmetsp:Transcript_16921/g.54090  ORF Transcript_16921/g.54090 Transcript_16921/m.54090 type:complete len:348 (-) Transcript_16921:49-1092(-)
MAIFERLFGAFCRAEDLPACCGCKEEPEVLTKAWIDSLEQVSVLGETTVKVQPPPPGGTSTPTPGSRGGDTQPPEGRVPIGPPRPGQGQATTGSGSLAMLAAPPEFDSVRGGVLHGPASEETEPRYAGISQLVLAEQRQGLQACMRAFTRCLLRGISVSVLLDDGCTCLAEARMDSELTHLVLHVPNAQHPVALRSIESVSTPEESWLPQVAGGRLGNLEVCCATLIIEGGQFLTLVFDSSRTREYFEVCLKVLILARESGSPSAKHMPEQHFQATAIAVQPRTGDDGPAPVIMSPEFTPVSTLPVDGVGERSLHQSSRAKEEEPPSPPPPPPPPRDAGSGEPTTRV